MRFGEKGYSLVEVVIAAGVVGIIALSVLSSFPYIAKMNRYTRSSGSCRAYIDTAFSRIEQFGFRGDVPDTAA